MTLYHARFSGNSHRVHLMLSLLGLPFREVEIDLFKGEHKQPPFLGLNPWGRVPVLADDGLVIRDSLAILVYLAEKYGDDGWYPKEPVERAAVSEWLGIAGDDVVRGPGVAMLTKLLGDYVKADYDDALKRAYTLLKIMDAHLTGRDWLASDRPTIADVACYCYVASAPKGGIDLAPYAQVRQWLRRVEGLSGFVPFINAVPAGSAAA
ncbi:MAG: glutathione S-transferase family protein [Alphaproteobacteria bacterium]|nr:MAG: glutathione S-transferase family protein [Alphaproteobacteria bacterium]